MYLYIYIYISLLVFLYGQYLGFCFKLFRQNPSILLLIVAEIDGFFPHRPPVVQSVQASRYTTQASVNTEKIISCGLSSDVIQESSRLGNWTCKIRIFGPYIHTIYTLGSYIYIYCIYRGYPRHPPKLTEMHHLWKHNLNSSTRPISTRKVNKLRSVFKRLWICSIDWMLIPCL